MRFEALRSELTSLPPLARFALADRSESVRIAKVRYTAGASHLLTVLIMQSERLKSQVDLIALQSAQLATRIDLRLALGGGFGGPPTDPSGSRPEGQ